MLGYPLKPVSEFHVSSFKGRYATPAYLASDVRDSAKYPGTTFTTFTREAVFEFHVSSFNGG
jgi:hypothetical protein